MTSALDAFTTVNKGKGVSTGYFNPGCFIHTAVCLELVSCDGDAPLPSARSFGEAVSHVVVELTIVAGSLLYYS